MEEVENIDSNDIATVIQWLQEADNIVVFTGAGISTDSGIPDFRGPQGLWRTNPLAERTSTLSYYLNDPEVRKVAWAGRERTFDGSALPNDGHKALVRLQRANKLSAVVTQNVDGLHQASGIEEDKVWELHGTIAYARCWGCDDRRPMGDYIERVRQGEEDPDCFECGGIVKSDAVLFEQSLNPEVIHGAFAAAENCSLMLAIGSTLGVSPANQAVVRARASGARVVIINGEETELDHIAHVRLVGSITPILKALMDGAEFPT